MNRNPWIYLIYEKHLKHFVAFVEDGSAAGKIGPFFQSLFQAIIFFPLSQVSYDVMYLHVQSKQGAIIKLQSRSPFLNNAGNDNQTQVNIL